MTAGADGSDGFLLARLNRDPPANIQAEQALLGAIMANNAAYWRVCDFLTDEHFGDPIHARVYRRISQRINAGQLADAVTLWGDFQERGILEEVGGKAYLAKLLTAMVGVITAGEYGRAILDAWLGRQMIEAAEGLVGSAYGGAADAAGRPEAVRGAMASLAAMMAAGDPQAASVATIGDAARAAIAGYEAAARGEPSTVLRSGFVEVDEAIGGFPAGHLVILAGRSRMGKTALAVQLAQGVAERLAEDAASAPPLSGAGGYVVLFSHEMDRTEIGGRAVAAASGIGSGDLAAGRIMGERGHALIEAQRYLDGLPLLVNDCTGMTADGLVASVRAIGVRHRVRLVVIDHLQKMRPEMKGGREWTTNPVGQITSRLKDAARELKLPILLLQQLSRDIDRRPDPRPRLDDLTYAGENDADTVAMLWRPELYLPRTPPERSSYKSEEAWSQANDAWHRKRAELEHKAELLVVKRRGGRESLTVLHFDGEVTAFRPLAAADAGQADLYEVAD